MCSEQQLKRIGKVEASALQAKERVLSTLESQLRERIATHEELKAKKKLERKAGKKNRTPPQPSPDKELPVEITV